MKIIIVGAGTVGFNLATKLSQLGHDLFLIDPNKPRLRLAEEGLDIKSIHGDATSVDILRQAEVESAHLVISVSSVDAINLLTCHLAHKMGAQRTIARIRQSRCFLDPTVLTSYDLGIDSVIYPEQEVAKEIFHLISRSFASAVNTFFNDQIESIGLWLEKSSPLVGKNLESIQKMSSLPFSFVGLMRQTKIYLTSEEIGVLSPGDKIFLLAKESDVPDLVSSLGFETKKLNNLFVYGGTHTGLLLAKLLEGIRSETRIIEPDVQRARELALELKKVLVLHGEGTDTHLLVGEGIHEADVFVAVTENDELNLLSCLLAKQLGARKTVALVSKPDFNLLVGSLNIDSILSKRTTTINHIMQYVRQGEVVSVSEISEDQLEAIEYRISKFSQLVGKPLGGPEFKEIFPKQATIGAILTAQGEVLIPQQKTELGVGDKVIVYSNINCVEELEKIFV